MAERDLFDELDRAVDTYMNGQTLSAELPPAVAELLGLAARLRQLPDPTFRARLKVDLLARVESSQPRAVTGGEDDIQRALEEMVARPRFVSYDLQAAFRDLPELSMRFLAAMNDCTIGVSRFSEKSRWERHPAADELLYLLDGDMEVTTLTSAGPTVSTVHAGSIFICPRALWHRIDPLSPVSLLFATPGEGTELSAAEPAVAFSPVAESTVAPPYDLHSLLAGVRELKIFASTTTAEADAAFRQITSFNQSALSIGRFRGLTPWERHRGGDELLHLLQGEAEITVLTDDGPVHRHIAEGDLFVCPQGLWHRQLARETVTGLYVTPRPSDISWAEDPRTGPHAPHD